MNREQWIWEQGTVWGDGEMGRWEQGTVWGDGEMGRWGDGEMGRWGDWGVTHHRVKLLPLASCLLPSPPGRG
ncbi:hypothetical protein [Moorena sp. SIO3H5]|uniref:hypothetical protein n=1 Tax=Moorena sp. SIO3H5 TaxID=2607834 RepID=UPI0013B6D205|nr:hypothetical protein [Moorena sp. SIO3H5]NEO73800.1 hypothetical protein [Moorena sp. SIO3H5]